MDSIIVTSNKNKTACTDLLKLFDEEDSSQPKLTEQSKGSESAKQVFNEGFIAKKEDQDANGELKSESALKSSSIAVTEKFEDPSPIELLQLPFSIPS